jgi:hypothetical protein
VDGARRGLPWRWVGRSIGAVLLAIAAALLLITVETSAGGRRLSCGSGWDVLAGRSGWRAWWAQDLADPATGDRLARTANCPDAVNTHIVLAAVLAAAALLAIGAGEFADRRRAAQSSRPGPGRRLHRLGTAVTALGGALTAAGLAGIALLVANPDATLFLYVGRPVVVLVGLLLLLPAVLLIVLGRGATVLADQLTRTEESHEPT